MTLHAAQKALRKKASPARAVVMQRFFKTGKGEYGEGDLFLGIKALDLQLIAKQFALLEQTNASLLSQLLKSPFHEDRALAAHIVVIKYKKSKGLPAKKIWVDFYLKNRNGLNNWDLVDLSAHKVIGDFTLLTGDERTILRLSNSKRHWDKRIAVVSTFAMIRTGDTRMIYALAKKFLGESEDLMHKAVGWMLREAGKRDAQKLLVFIDQFGHKMPRTMLRYSIEKFSKSQRDRILKVTKGKKHHCLA